MDKKKLAAVCLNGGGFVLIAATLIRLGNLTDTLHMPIEGLWKLSVGLLLMSIALSVSKA